FSSSGAALQLVTPNIRLHILPLYRLPVLLVGAKLLSTHPNLLKRFTQVGLHALYVDMGLKKERAEADAECSRTETAGSISDGRM
ncbi:MAG: hypothetical protein FWC70_00400, partial [Defluviitaleaceae bacterium]|nr:hypothetical protein [Defluviitaleaceae bacterium]